MLNVKDPEAHRLAKQLAELEGISLTAAVTGALRAALAEHGRQRAARRDALTALVRTARDLDMTPENDPIAELYDPETGLPGSALPKSASRP
jgi:antitoxin VapB